MTFRGIPLLVVWLASALALFGSAEHPRVFYVNSYHRGYGSSDDVMRGLEAVLAQEKIPVVTEFLDAKRRSPAEIEQAAQTIRQRIAAEKPDLLIVSDDNAVQSLVVPCYKQGPMPVVFCGVNWSCDAYGLPTPNVCGMLEVVPIFETIAAVQAVRPTARRVTILSEASVSEESNRRILDPMFRSRGLETRWVLVPDFAAWKQAFASAQEGTDLIYLPTNGAIKGWDAQQAEECVATTARVPVVTCDDFMMRYAMFGLTKVAREQGEWAAKVAVDILRGKRRPSDVPLARNEQTRAWFNEKLARTIGFEIAPELKARASAPAQ